MNENFLDEKDQKKLLQQFGNFDYEKK